MDENTLVYNLSGPLEFTKAGDFTETHSLELGPPSMESLDEAYDLSQLVMGAMMDARRLAKDADTEERKGGGDDKMGGDAVRMILFSATAAVKVSDVAAKFKALVCKVGTLDGEVKITLAHIGKMSLPDFSGLMCEYISNFIVPSLLSEGGND